MKKHFQLLILFIFSFLIVENAFSQDKYGDSPDICKEKLSEFFEYAKTKDYEYAYKPWLWCFENCPKASKNIYKYGLKIIEDRYQKASVEQKKSEAQLIDKIFEQRIQYFPDNLGKVYSDWAISLESRNAPKEQVSEKLQLAFQNNPAQMSLKNIFKYFQEITDKNKNTNLQLIFDTYDDALDAVNKKINYHSKASDALNKKVSEEKTLSKREKIQLKNHGINLRGLGQVEAGLDNIIGEIASCDKLIPLYTKSLDAHKNDAKWLKRAVSRLHYKECTEDAIYPKMVEAYVNADPSPEASVFYAGILLKRGKQKEATEYFNKAVEQETDTYKKADYLYKIARVMKARGRKSEARSYARKAIQNRPSMGKAYLLIASLYASSANSCGTDEFSKRMTYIAAVNKARKAKVADPSITSLANRYIKSYTASGPSKKLIFTKGEKSGASYTIKCWINETVKIP